MKPALSRALLLISLGALACGPASEPESGHIHFADRDLMSINDRCPVRGDPLSPQVEPVYVNGRPLGFC